MEKIEQYWQKFCEHEGLKGVRYTEAFQFGAKPDWLASLVLEGKKQGTCSSYPLYEIEGAPLPKVGDYQIVLNSQDEPVAIILSTHIGIYPFKDVPVEFALSEGQGTYEQWKDAHIKFFSQLLPDFGLTFNEDMLTVCDSFKMVYPK